MRSKNEKFQVGDVIVPIPGKTQSNYWKLERLKRLEVILTEDGYSSLIEVKIIKGTSSRYKGARIWVNCKQFQLETPKTDSYEIF